MWAGSVMVLPFCFEHVHHYLFKYCTGKRGPICSVTGSNTQS